MANCSRLKKSWTGVSKLLNIPQQWDMTLMVAQGAVSVIKRCMLVGLHRLAEGSCGISNKF